MTEQELVAWRAEPTTDEHGNIVWVVLVQLREQDGTRWSERAVEYPPMTSREQAFSLVDSLNLEKEQGK